MRIAGLSELASNVIAFCYPPQCAACAQRVEVGSHFCAECGVVMDSLEAEPFCELCGMPVPQAGAPCARCVGKGVPHFERVIRLGVFRDPLKHLIHQMKYHRRWTIAEILARRLIAHEPVKALLQQTDVLVPVPLHPFRQIARGYNQADVIARVVGRACGIKVSHPLSRVKRTPMQTTMSSHEKRMANLRGAFVLDREKAIRGKHVVVIDDVMTTGATIQSAARELESAKPASISALVVAVADPKGSDFQLI